MKKLLFTLCLCLMTTFAFAGSILIEGFEYANHDLVKPIGWVCDDDSWLCGYQEKDHNRIPHSGNWYAFSNADDSWMFMQLYLITDMQYRFTCWAISDGSCQLEFWAGTSPADDDMHTRFFSTTVGSESYEKVSNYVETIPEGCHYIGIRALTNGNATHLTIDDIEIDMVEQYDFIAEPITGDSSMYPGTQGIFHFMVQNIGYDALDITIHPANEFFTDFSCIVNGVSGMTFHTEPDEVVEATITATLRPEIEPGTICWLDVNMTIPCNCNTAFVTFWVTPLETENATENAAMKMSVFPNPACDFVTVEGGWIQQITLYDWTGRMVKCIPVENKQAIISLEGLKSGGYLIIAKGKERLARQALIKQ